MTRKRPTRGSAGELTTMCIARLPWLPRRACLIIFRPHTSPVKRHQSLHDGRRRPRRLADSVYDAGANDLKSGSIVAVEDRNCGKGGDVPEQEEFKTLRKLGIFRQPFRRILLIGRRGERQFDPDQRAYPVPSADDLGRARADPRHAVLPGARVQLLLKDIEPATPDSTLRTFVSLETLSSSPRPTETTAGSSGRPTEPPRGRPSSRTCGQDRSGAIPLN
jgi:hypothetical protein